MTTLTFPAQSLTKTMTNRLTTPVTTKHPTFLSVTVQIRTNLQ